MNEFWDITAAGPNRPVTAAFKLEEAVSTHGFLRSL